MTRWCTWDLVICGILRLFWGRVIFRRGIGRRGFCIWIRGSWISGFRRGGAFIVTRLCLWVTGWAHFSNPSLSPYFLKTFANNSALLIVQSFLCASSWYSHSCFINRSCKSQAPFVKCHSGLMSCEEMTRLGIVSHLNFLFEFPQLRASFCNKCCLPIFSARFGWTTFSTWVTPRCWPFAMRSLQTVYYSLPKWSDTQHVFP